MQGHPIDAPPEEGVADVAAECLDALLLELEDTVLRDRLVDLPATLRTALLGGPASHAASRTVRRRLADLERAAGENTQLLADLGTFREALALIRDDVDDAPADR